MQTQVEFAAKSIGYCSWAAACYQAQRNNGTGHHAALRVLAYKWDRMIGVNYVFPAPTIIFPVPRPQLTSSISLQDVIV